MRNYNSPSSSKGQSIYKSSSMRKVGPQEVILTSTELPSTRQLKNVKSQQSIRVNDLSSHKNGNSYQTQQYGYEQNMKSYGSKIYQPPMSPREQSRQIIYTPSQLGYNEKKNNIILTQSYDNNNIQQFQQSRPEYISHLTNITSQINNQQQISEKLYTYQNGDEYIGQWIKDKVTDKQLPNGYGCYKFKQQNLQYRGYLKNGKMHGIGTLHKLVNRGKPEMIYQGQWMDGQKNGTGKYYYDQYTIYEGNWNKNKKSGKGIFKSPQCIYDGLWLDDKKHGKGILKLLQNSTEMDGQWINDEIISGTVRYQNGDKYTGNKNRFERNGQGQYIWGNNQQIYKGYWKGNRKQGTGQISYDIGQKYTGQMRDNMRQGNNCTYEWRNGSKIIGQFKDNIPVRGKFIGQGTSFDFDMTKQPNRNH